MKIWNMHTIIWAWVQRYLSIKYHKIKVIFRAHPVLIPAAFLPVPLMVAVMFIVLPAFSFYLPSNSETSGNANMHLRQLKIDHSFYTAQIVKAKSKADSISLTIDLVDSTVVLDLKGVPLRTCRLKSYSLHLDIFAQTDSMENLFTKPLILQNYWASTEKIPVIEKMAPKDTVEANQQLVEPVSPPQDDIYAYLQYDNNFLLYIGQIESPDLKGLWNKSRMHYTYLLKELRRSVDGLINGDGVEPYNQIEVYLEQKDARAIYRSLPPNSMLTLRIQG